MKKNKIQKIKITYSLFIFLFILSISSVFASNFSSLLDKNKFKDFLIATEKEQKFYYDNGNLKSKQFYIKNRKSGTWEYYYENGILKSSVSFNYSSPYEEATVKNFDINGFLLNSGKMVNGEKVSIWKYYDENEKINHIFDYTSGEILIFNEDGKTIFKIDATEFSNKLKDIQEEIKDDRVKSSEE